MPENSNVKNPISPKVHYAWFHLICLNFIPKSKWRLAVVICFVTERPPLDYAVDYVNVAETHGHIS